MSHSKQREPTCPECGDGDELFPCDGPCGKSICAACDPPRNCQSCDGICCEECLEPGASTCAGCQSMPNDGGTCDYCGYVRRPYEHPDTVKTCKECENTHCCESCEDDGRVKISTCCEGCHKCKNLLQCDNCSETFCKYQCHQKVCNGCESCEKVNSGKLLGWIFHCQKCDLTMCCECEMNPEDHSCDE
jgi:hypothetical protein